MVWLTSLIVIYGFISIWYVMYVNYSLLILRVSTLAFKLIWFSFWGILSCKMLWCIHTISMCQTDTVSYVKMMYFTSILQVISPILLLWFMLLAYISNLWILWAKSITVKPLMFAAINVRVFMSRTISLPLKFAFFMRNISLIYIFADSALGCLNHC